MQLGPRETAGGVAREGSSHVGGTSSGRHARRPTTRESHVGEKDGTKVRSESGRALRTRSAPCVCAVRPCAARGHGPHRIFNRCCANALYVLGGTRHAPDKRHGYR